MSIKKAAAALVVPAVISQLVMLVYNMADTWYIGRTGDPFQVAVNKKKPVKWLHFLCGRPGLQPFVTL